MFPKSVKTSGAISSWQRTLYAVFLAQLASAIGMSTIFPFLPFYVEQLGTHTTLSIEFLSGAVFSAQAATMMLASPFWGSLADRYGRKLMVQRATFGGAAILLLMAFARSAEELVLLRAVQGLVTGVVSAANALVAAAAPRERAGYAMGMIQVALWSGLAVGPLLGGAIADAFGYRQTFILTSILLTAAGLTVWFGVEEQLTSTQKKRDGRTRFLSGWQQVLNKSGVKPIYSLRFISGLASMLIVPVAPMFMQLLLPNATRVNTFTGLMTALASAATTATAIYLSRLGDRIGHRRILQVSALLAGLFYLPQSLVTEAWQLIVLQALAGAAAGGIIPSISALLTSYTELGEEGSAFGLDSSIFAASRAVAPLAGSVVALWFGLPAVFFVTALAYLLLTLLAVRYLPEPVRQPLDGQMRRGRAAN